MTGEIAIFAALGAGVSALIERYRVTSQPRNPWTAEGIMNVLAHVHHFEAARSAVSGVITSCFRSAEVNAAIGGSPTSDHLVGRAVDIVPQGMSIHDASLALYAAVERGEFGSVREVLEEPGCVHIGWMPLGSGPHKARLGKWRM